MKADIVVNQARGYLGVPFVHQGRSDKGLDCVGLVVRVAHDLGLSKYDFKEYKSTPNSHTFMEVCRACEDWSRIPITEMKPGDILTISFTSSPCHLAIVAPGFNIIHALSLRGKVCEHRLSAGWRKKIRECYRFKGVE